jgi:tetratricopeptide (TPR) repeat protein
MFKIWNKVGEPLFDQGYWNDFEQCAVVILKAADIVHEVAAQAQVLNELGWVYMESEHFSIANEFFNKSLEKYQALHNEREECKVWRYLGVLSHRQREFQQAINFYSKAQGIAIKKDRLNDENWAFQEAELHNIFGETYLELQDFSQSYSELEQSIEKYEVLIAKHPKYRYYITDPFLNLGRWHFLQRAYEQARNYYQQCLEISKSISRPDTQARALLFLAEVAKAQDYHDQAFALAQEAKEMAGEELKAIREQITKFLQQTA